MMCDYEGVDNFITHKSTRCEYSQCRRFAVAGEVMHRCEWCSKLLCLERECYLAHQDADCFKHHAEHYSSASVASENTILGRVAFSADANTMQRCTLDLIQADGRVQQLVVTLNMNPPEKYQCYKLGIKGAGHDLEISTGSFVSYVFYGARLKTKPHFRTKSPVTRAHIDFQTDRGLLSIIATSFVTTSDTWRGIEDPSVMLQYDGACSIEKIEIETAV
jgi:hypothetical protein